MTQFVALLALAAFSLSSSQARADDAVQPIERDADRLRVSLGSGLAIIAGPDITVDGERVADESPTSPFVSLNAVARVDVALSRLVLMGVQGAALLWTTTSSDYTSASHVTIDAGALVRFRYALGSYDRNEAVASLVLGPSFDSYSLGGRTFGGSVDQHFGWHAGLLATYQYRPVRNWVGYFLEAGIVYHRLSMSIDYEGATEDIVAEPVELLVRAGMMIPFF